MNHPSHPEIIDLLRAHPLIKLKERVTASFLVGSFAKEALGLGDTHSQSDVDILLEVKPRIGTTAEELEEQYRSALRNYFVKHDIRGKDDSVHPQWDGRRVDVYFTYDATTEKRPMVALARDRPVDSDQDRLYQREGSNG